MCGDEAGKAEKWDIPGNVVSTYRPGQTINVDVVVAVNHLGRFDMTICDLNAKSWNMTRACTQLQR